MSNQLTFNNTQLSVINRNNQIWLSSKELAKALQYTDSKSVTRLYNTNCDEFSTNMSQVIESVTSGNYKKKVRIFSLRGCHLIAMFSRTEIAKEFRKWVLDILDKEIGIIETINEEQKYLISKAIDERVYRTGEKHQTIYHKFYDQFKISSYKELPVSKFNDAIAFLGGVQIRHSLSDDDWYSLAWLYKAADRMRFYIEQVEPALRILVSEKRGAFYSMSHDYKHILNRARKVIDRETMHVQPKGITDNWHKVLPVVRDRVDLQ